MPKQQDIRTLVDQFVSNISVLVHEQALDTVRAALGEGAAPKRRGPGRPRKAGKRGPGRPPKAAGRRGPGRPRKASRRVRRSSADLEATSAKVLAYVRANAGQRLEEIGRGLRTATAGLKRPIQVLVADGKLRTEGQKRGTKYFAGNGRGRKAKAGRKSKRKTTKRAMREKGAKFRGRRMDGKSAARRPAKRSSPKQTKTPEAVTAVSEAVQAA